MVLQRLHGVVQLIWRAGELPRSASSHFITPNTTVATYMTWCAMVLVPDWRHLIASCLLLETCNNATICNMVRSEHQRSVISSTGAARSTRNTNQNGFGTACLIISALPPRYMLQWYSMVRDDLSTRVASSRHQVPTTDIISARRLCRLYCHFSAPSSNMSSRPCCEIHSRISRACQCFRKDGF